MARQVCFHSDAWAEYLVWQETDKKITSRINSLIKEIQRTPFTGTGKPEPLRYEMKGFWSRRIDSEHRLVYKATSEEIIIIQCRYHY